jgi:mRNA interferase MazF
MKINKFHIYLADLNPRFGAEPGKVRPVVVIQTDLLNSVHPSTIICPITTKVIRKSSVLMLNLLKKGAGLKQDSDILVDQIRAIDNRRFIKHLGQITNTQKQSLLQNLNVIVLE